MSETHGDYRSKASILSLLRLSIGMSENLKTHPPDDEERELVERIIVLRNSLMKILDDDRSQMIVAMAAVTQLLEGVLCHYRDDMPDVLTAIFAKLAQHGTRHMDLKDNPPQEVMSTGTIIH
jgi:hypothetical protein